MFCYCRWKTTRYVHEIGSFHLVFFLLHFQDLTPSGTTYKDKMRLVAFAQDATRTLEIFAQGDVIDIINPTVAKTKEEFIKDMTVIYELRVNPETKIELFRKDPANCPDT